MSTVRWRLHCYWQDPEPETTPERDTLAEIREDLDRVAAEWDWVYIARRLDDGPWAQVAFAGFHNELPDAWDYIETVMRDEQDGGVS